MDHMLAPRRPVASPVMESPVGSEKRVGVAQAGRVGDSLTRCPARLKYVNPDRRVASFSRAFAAFSSTRLGRFFSAKVVWKVDPYLLRATRGHLGMGLVLPTALLETRGRESGVVRRNAVIYFHDQDRVTIVASKAGAAKHPAWFHNLVAQPDVIFGGIPMRATSRQRRGGTRQDLGARRPRVCALRDLPPRSGTGAPDDPDRPARATVGGRLRQARHILLRALARVYV